MKSGAHVAVRPQVFVEAVAERADIEAVVQIKPCGHVEPGIRSEIVLIMQARRRGVVFAPADQIDSRKQARGIRSVWPGLTRIVRAEIPEHKQALREPAMFA